MKIKIIILMLFAALSLTGCMAAVVGATATGAYAVGKDKGPVGQYADDAVITSKIKAKYLADINLKSYNISVVTHDGAVTLTGTVPTVAMRDDAIVLARHTTGVKLVNVTNFRVAP